MSRVRSLAVPVGKLACARMIGARRSAPVSFLGIEIQQESCRIERILLGLHHLLDRREIPAMPFVVQLKTANIETARTGTVMPVDIGKGRVRIIEPDPLSLHVDGPGPRTHRTIAPAPGFGERDRLENRDRNACSGGGHLRGPVAKR